MDLWNVETGSAANTVAGQSTGRFITEGCPVSKPAYIAEWRYPFEMTDTYGDERQELLPIQSRRIQYYHEWRAGSHQQQR
jgi:hypothetical protein